MDDAFLPAMVAAWGGDLDGFVSILDNDRGLASRPSSCSHPTLLQFVVLDGGMGKIPGGMDFARALIKRGAGLDEPVVAAASIGAREFVDFLLDAGARLEACAPWTPLEESVYWGHVELAEHLWRDKGAEIPSLRAAAGLGALPQLRAYIESGPSPEATGSVRFPWGHCSDDPQDILDQALVIAAKNGRVRSAELLLDQAARINAFPPGIHEGGAPLHLAAMLGGREIVSLLLRHGADPALPDPQHHSTPAGWARHGGHEELAQALERSTLPGKACE